MLFRSDMYVSVLKIKGSFQIFACVILVILCSCSVNAQDNIDNTKILRKTCMLEPSLGPCRSKMTMYYFDPDDKSCKEFFWGGCQGNGNRFDTQEECYSSCLTNLTSLRSHRPRYCFLAFDYGYCFGAVPRYYYDPMWKVCKERLYSGCGGNKNNFYNIEQCESICRLGTGFIKSIKMKKDQIKKVIIINPAAAGSTTKADHHLQTRKVAAPTAAADKT